MCYGNLFCRSYKKYAGCYKYCCWFLILYVLKIVLYIHLNWGSTCHTQNILSQFSLNSKACVSEFLANHEEMSPLYYFHTDVCSRIEKRKGQSSCNFHNLNIYINDIVCYCRKLHFFSWSCSVYLELDI